MFCGTRRWARAGAVLATAAALSACSHARPKTAPAAPPLQVPPPPPRVVEPAQNEPPAPVPLPKEPERSAPARPAPRAEAAKPEPPKPEEPKPDTVAEPKPDEGPRATTLQTTPAGEESAVEQTVRAQLGRAAGFLAHIDYQRLNLDARTQYDTAKRLIKQAEDALRARNLVFAKTLADKAAALAAQLAGK